MKLVKKRGWNSAKNDEVVGTLCILVKLNVMLLSWYIMEKRPVRMLSAGGRRH